MTLGLTSCCRRPCSCSPCCLLLLPLWGLPPLLPLLHPPPPCRTMLRAHLSVLWPVRIPARLAAVAHRAAAHALPQLLSRQGGEAGAHRAHMHPRGQRRRPCSSRGQAAWLPAQCLCGTVRRLLHLQPFEIPRAAASLQATPLFLHHHHVPAVAALPLDRADRVRQVSNTHPDCLSAAKGCTLLQLYLRLDPNDSMQRHEGRTIQTLELASSLHVFQAGRTRMY